jgi:6-pyruvoyltetrahydropterin/6-carboxytetrahydropterin synthase
MFRISKQFAFSASHVLDCLEESHPCARLHGHNYVVTVHLQSETLNAYGFVTDYHALKTVKDYLDEHLDHRHLNDLLPFHPTAENIARHIYEKFCDQLPEMYAVEVSETPKTSAVYEPHRQ